ncbi:MAG: hypothetical protein ABSG64_13905 [Solirubrobacteraceae bacterium]
MRLWDPASSNCLRTLAGHTNYVASVAFSPDGSLLVSASFDKTLRLWNPASGGCLRTLAGHTAELWSVAFRAYGNLLASASPGQRAPAAGPLR